MAGYQQIQIWIGNYCSWAGFLYTEYTILSMKPIHVGIVITFQFLRSIFHWKRLQYILMINLGWIVKCAFHLGGGAGPFLITRKKCALLTSILCYRVNAQLPIPFLLSCDLPQKSKCLNWWRSCFHERFFRSLSEWQPEIPWKQLLFQLA